MTGPDTGDEEQRELAALRERHPRWSIWKGRHTGHWWAAPPAPRTALLEARDLGELERKIADVEAWEAGQ